VAADTVPGCPRVDSITVASCAVGGRVLATQAVLVIENSLIPRNIVGTVADIALRREARGHVIWFPSVLVISAVARIAVRGDRAIEPAIRVATNAIYVLVLPTNVKPCFRLVIPLGRDPPNRLVASFAIHAEVGAERVFLSADPMAVVTVGGSALDLPIPVARCAGNLEVPALERQEGRLVEPPRRVFEVRVHRVAGGAVVAQRLLVGIFVAGRAISCKSQERSGRVTVRAVTGKFTVVSLDGESGLSGMIEVRRVNGSQVSVASLVLGVAHGTVLDRGIAMDSLFCGHAPGDQIVADETSVSIDIEIVVVAVLAAVWILEPFVGKAEATWHEVDLVFLCERRHRARDQNRR